MVLWCAYISDHSGGDYWSVISRLRHHHLCWSHVALQVRPNNKNNNNDVHFSIKSVWLPLLYTIFSHLYAHNIYNNLNSCIIFFVSIHKLQTLSPDIDGQFAFTGVLSQNLLLLLILHYCVVWFCDEINVLSSV